MSATPENTIRVSADGFASSYLRYSQKLVKEQSMQDFILTGTGTAIENTVRVGEYMRQLYPQAHRIITIGLREIEGEGERGPRQLPFVSIHFILGGKVDKHVAGYHAPSNDKPVDAEAFIDSIKNVKGRRPNGGQQSGAPRRDRAPRVQKE
jgi:Alba